MIYALCASLILHATAATASDAERRPAAAERARADEIHRIVIVGTPSPVPPEPTVSGVPSGVGEHRQAQAGAASPTPEPEKQPPEQAQVAQLAAQARQLETTVALLRRQLALERERTAALEREAEAQRALRQYEAEEPVRRAQALTVETDRLTRLDQVLATGSIDAAPAIAQAQARLADSAASAGAGGREDEASYSATASGWLAESQDAIRRGDLYDARLALDAAQHNAQRALSLAATTTGGAARPPLSAPN